LAEPARLRYAVRYVNAAGKRGLLKLLSDGAGSQGRRTANHYQNGTEYSETANTITWETAEGKHRWFDAGKLLGFNLYRTIMARRTDGPVTA